MSAAHLVLVGESIFDKRAYVMPGHSVSDQLRSRVGATAQVRLLAVDGHLSGDVPVQDLREFSIVSPIEPSVAGGEKIADMLNQWALGT